MRRKWRACSESLIVRVLASGHRPRFCAPAKLAASTPTTHCQSRRCRSRPARPMAPNAKDRDNTTFPEVAISATDACAQAGARNARDRISLAEVHDCFTPTELVLMEYPGASARGTAWRDTLDSRVGIGGAQPVNPDGGLMSFGHPIGASEFRMMYERWLRFRGESGPSQVEAPRLGLTQNLGKVQERCVGFVSVVRTN